jgi:hypothetical protein
MQKIPKKIHDSYSSLKGVIDNYLTPRSRKIIKYGILIFLIVAFIPEVYLVPCYFAIVKPTGETEINQILEKVQVIKTTDEKVNTISDWEEQNFTNIYGIKPNLSLDFGAFFLYGDGRYPVYINTSNQQPIKIRAPLSPFTNDPYWITYFHSGACGELAELFNYLVNKSYIESRIVQTRGEDHEWVEVKINGSWKYFDPTLVEIFQKNPEYRSKWFGESKDFESAWTWNVSRVVVSSTQEDITSGYTQVVNISVLLTSSKQISVSKYDNGKKKWIDLFSREVTSQNNQTIELIQLGESNRYKIRVSNYGNGFIPIPMYQEQEIFLNSTENVSMSLNTNNGQYDFVPGFILIGTCLIALGYEIKWIRQRLKKRKEKKL